MKELKLYFTGAEVDSCYAGTTNKVSLIPVSSTVKSTVTMDSSREVKASIDLIDDDVYSQPIPIIAGQIRGAVRLKVSKSGFYKVYMQVFALTSGTPCEKTEPLGEYSNEVRLDANAVTLVDVFAMLEEDVLVPTSLDVLYEVHAELLDEYEEDIEVEFTFNGNDLALTYKLGTTDQGPINPNDLVHIQGIEVIEGQKIFSKEIHADRGIKFGNANLGAAPNGEVAMVGAGFIYEFNSTGSPVNNFDLVNKKYVDDVVAGIIPPIDMTQFVLTTTDQTVDGVKTFMQEIKAERGIKFDNANMGALPSGELGIAGAGYVYGFSETGAPVEDFDLTTKAYVDTAIGGILPPDLTPFVTITGDQDIDGTKTFIQQIKADGGIKFGNENIGELAGGGIGFVGAGYVYELNTTGIPVNEYDIATKKYVDENGGGTVGPAGPMGPEGAQGIQGEPGLQGADGANGTDGVNGAVGPQGIQGEVGLPGADSTVPGPQGEPGIAGADGAQGIQGEAGPTGQTGAKGDAGTDGTNGIDGADGIQGIPGIQGNDGAPGAKGDKGDTGADSVVPGPQGLQGEQGIPGADGIQGEQGLPGADSTVAGPAGEQGIQGIPGDPGIAGADGAQGIQGPAGTNGLPGADGLQGPAGSDGTQGIQGVPGADGFDGADGTNGEYFELGSIIQFSGLVADIPNGWSVCDGTNGTPNLIGKFIKADISSGGFGGSTSTDSSEVPLQEHTHTGTAAEAGAHTHQYEMKTGYSNASGIGGDDFVEQNPQQTATSSDGLHTHSVGIDVAGSGTGAHTHTFMPEYYSLIFIMKTSVVAPAIPGAMFITDADTPESYIGATGKVVTVNSTEDGLVFSDAPAGTPGPQGDKGDTGAQGPKGDTGLPGADSTVPGPIGPKGEKGDKGDQGADAISGLAVKVMATISGIGSGSDYGMEVHYTDGASYTYTFNSITNGFEIKEDGATLNAVAFVDPLVLQHYGLYRNGTVSMHNKDGITVDDCAFSFIAYSKTNPPASPPGEERSRMIEMNINGLMPTNADCAQGAMDLGVTSGMFVIVDVFGIIKPNYLVNMVNDNFYVSMMVKAV